MPFLGRFDGPRFMPVVVTVGAVVASGVAYKTVSSARSVASSSRSSQNPVLEATGYAPRSSLEPVRPLVSSSSSQSQSQNATVRGPASTGTSATGGSGATDWTSIQPGAPNSAFAEFAMSGGTSTNSVYGASMSMEEMKAAIDSRQAALRQISSVSDQIADLKENLERGYRLDNENCPVAYSPDETARMSASVEGLKTELRSVAQQKTDLDTKLSMAGNPMYDQYILESYNKLKGTLGTGRVNLGLEAKFNAQATLEEMSARNASVWLATNSGDALQELREVKRMRDQVNQGAFFSRIDEKLAQCPHQEQMKAFFEIPVPSRYEKQIANPGIYSGGYGSSTAGGR